MALTGSLPAVVLAGGPSDDLSQRAPGAPNKAFVPVAGVTLVRRTLEALRAAPSIGRIVAVAPLVPPALRELGLADEVRPDGATMSLSLRAGLRGFDSNEPVLVAASDLAMLTCAAVEEFVALARASDADIVYACVERDAHERRFPHMRHTWARLRDGTFCGGGLVAMRPRALAALEGFLGRLGAARKNPLQLAAIFGYDALVNYALGQLSIAAVEQRAATLLGVRAVAAICSRPEIAVNVDRVSDIEAVERAIARVTSSV